MWRVRDILVLPRKACFETSVGAVTCQMIYQDAITLLFRILFFGYAESRGLLPCQQEDLDYKENSFSQLCEEATDEKVPAPTLPKEADLSVLTGKTILIVGWPNEEINDNFRIVWHDGDKVDTRLQALAREADILVFLTSFGSHAAMWWLKEEAIEQDKPIYFVQARNLQKILAEASY
ncbi:MAG: DUF2325 domain-containing protein [Desulfitobacteriaceae bacterium]